MPEAKLKSPTTSINPTFCFVVTTCWKDLHYARVLIESLYYFHPATPVKIIVDGDASAAFLRKMPNVVSIDHTADLNRLHGLGLHGLLSDLNLFFFDDFDYYIRVDADSVLIGDMLEGIQSRLPFDFLSLDGQTLDLHDEGNLRLFSEYAFSPSKIQQLGEEFSSGTVLYFSGGHFCSRRGLLDERFIAKWRPHLSPEFGKSPLFKFNDQSLLNFVVNSLSQKGEIKASVWPVTINGKAKQSDFPYVSRDNFLKREPLKYKIIHFTGPSRKWKFKDHNFGWALVFFDDLWYRRVGQWERFRDGVSDYRKHFISRKTWSQNYHVTRKRLSDINSQILSRIHQGSI